MSEYIYYSDGKPLANEHREISLAREEIVRCRDCKYVTADQSDHDFREPLWCSFHRMDVRTGGFCAWAERREP